MFDGSSHLYIHLATSWVWSRCGLEAIFKAVIVAHSDHSDFLTMTMHAVCMQISLLIGGRAGFRVLPTMVQTCLLRGINWHWHCCSGVGSIGCSYSFPERWTTAMMENGWLVTNEVFCRHRVGVHVDDWWSLAQCSKNSCACCYQFCGTDTNGKVDQCNHKNWKTDFYFMWLVVSSQHHKNLWHRGDGSQCNLKV